MFNDYLDDIKYCIKSFDIDESNYNIFKPSELGIKGDDSNRIYIKDANTVPSNIKFHMNSSDIVNCKIFIGKNLEKINDVMIKLQGKRGFFYLGDNARLNKLRIYLSDDDAYVFIGNGVSVVGENSKWITGSTPKNISTGIIVGDDCLIVGENTIRSSDEHIVVDLISDNYTNNPQNPVIIEPYCWLGQRTTILKNSRIGACSIAGFGSVITGSCDKFTLLRGVPAKAKSIYGKLWLTNEYTNAKRRFEMYKKRFILGEDSDNN